MKAITTFYLLLGCVWFLVFAWDIQNDRDFWTWVWLLNSQLNFLLVFKLIIEHKPNKDLFYSIFPETLERKIEQLKLIQTESKKTHITKYQLADLDKNEIEVKAEIKVLIYLLSD